VKINYFIIQWQNRDNWFLAEVSQQKNAIQQNPQTRLVDFEKRTLCTLCSITKVERIFGQMNIVKIK